jgi:hypothetical protein
VGGYAILEREKTKRAGSWYVRTTLTKSEANFSDMPAEKKPEGKVKNRTLENHKGAAPKFGGKGELTQLCKGAMKWEYPVRLVMCLGGSAGA